MKTTSVLLFILLCVTVSAQEGVKPAPFSSFNFGVSAGPNFTFPTQTGYLVQFEAGTSIASKLGVKIAVGLSSVFDDKSEHVKTYNRVKVNQDTKYQTYSYQIDKYEYAVFPLSIGLDYRIIEGDITPYFCLKGGSIYSR